MKMSVNDLTGNYAETHAMLSQELKKEEYAHGIEIQDIVGNYLCVACISEENAKFKYDDGDIIIAFQRDGREIARLDSTGVLRFRRREGTAASDSEEKVLHGLFGLITFVRSGYFYLEGITLDLTSAFGLDHYDYTWAGFPAYRSVADVYCWMGIKWEDGDSGRIILTPIKQYQPKISEIAPPYLIQLPNPEYGQTQHNRFTNGIQGRSQWDRFRKRVSEKVNAHPSIPMRQKPDRILRKSDKTWLTVDYYNMIPYNGHWNYGYSHYPGCTYYYGNIIVCEAKGVRLIGQASQRAMSDLEAVIGEEWELIGPWFWKPKEAQ